MSPFRGVGNCEVGKSKLEKYGKRIRETNVNGCAESVILLYSRGREQYSQDFVYEKKDARVLSSPG